MTASHDYAKCSVKPCIFLLQDCYAICYLFIVYEIPRIHIHVYGSCVGVSLPLIGT